MWHARETTGSPVHAKHSFKNHACMCVEVYVCVLIQSQEHLSKINTNFNKSNYLQNKQKLAYFHQNYSIQTPLPQDV